MRNSFKRFSFTIAAAAALTAVIPVSSAAALGRTDCGSRSDFLRITNYNRTQHLCFANAGSQYVKIYKVDKIEAGNNQVDVQINGRINHLDKWGSSINIDGSDLTITWIKIY
ncbi:beta/gamma crystallin domain-containing protein [Streptomyces sp. NPDC089915]|uniref:beta/gamma crystallin domain-containing protein n=1 Tax=Streptomyces sp. NPDC089915 TaxID=3155186 RepID=UPI00342308F5